jgi:hypothetical protein
MKIKKLLSIGALSLVVAFSTSIGASAATIPTELLTKESLLKIITNQYKNGTNPVQGDLLSGVTKDTTISNFLKVDVTTQNAVFASITPTSHPTAYKILTKIENNKDNTIAIVLGKATKDQDTFNKFKEDFKTVIKKVQDMNGKTGTDRKNEEEKVKLLVQLYDSNLNINFGIDSNGKTMVSLEKGNQILVQLNYDEFQTLINIVDGLTLDDVNNAIK